EHEHEPTPGTQHPPVATPHPTPSRLRSFKPAAPPAGRQPAALADFRARLGRPLRIRWEGHQATLSSLALVNRQFCLGLLAGGDVELSLSEVGNPWPDLEHTEEPRLRALYARREQPLSGPADITIRHHFPPNWQRP